MKKIASVDGRDYCFLGRYVTGCGKAHTHIAQHRPAFNCDMVGTFNLECGDTILFGDIPPTREINGFTGQPQYDYMKYYWLVRLSVAGGELYYGWLFKWEGSHMPVNKAEILTRTPLPDVFKTGEVLCEILAPWTEEDIANWAKTAYWFQSFPWSPFKKADSNLVWQAIVDQCSWADKSVLDVGTHYGYHALRATMLGARVTGVDIEEDTLMSAVLIAERIEKLDVVYKIEDPGGDFDTILYLSVHHQFDPHYGQLTAAISGYRKRCKNLFVELIQPPMFGQSLTKEQIETMVGGTLLHEYKHKVRGIRRIYSVAGDLA